jgi:hypothetical protein
MPFGIIGAALLAKLAAGASPASTSWMFVASFVTAMSMHLVLTPRFGATGAAIATLSRDPVAVGVGYLLVRHQDRVRDHLSDVVPLSSQMRIRDV